MRFFLLFHDKLLLEPSSFFKIEVIKEGDFKTRLYLVPYAKLIVIEIALTIFQTLKAICIIENPKLVNLN